MRRLLVVSALFASITFLTTTPSRAAEPWLVLNGKTGPGLGKRVVLISGDEEYRSEEALTQLAQILSERHGFECTVLFAIDKDGKVDPNRNDNIPGLEALGKADLMILFTRFRNLPDDQMKHIIDYVESGRPVIGLRTATHAFNFKPSSGYLKYTFNSKEPSGGFGRQVLGETWVNHYGAHGKQGTRGIIVDKSHPITRGIKDGDIYGPTDVYEVKNPLPGDCKPLVLGQILDGMSPTDRPIEGPKNDPMMPIAWVKTYTGEHGRTSLVFTTTMGASEDFVSPGLRRLLVNATYWATGLEDKIFAQSNVDFVGKFTPSPFGNNKFQKDKSPEDFLSK